MTIPPRSERFGARNDSNEGLFNKIRGWQHLINSPELESFLANPTAAGARNARLTHRALAESTGNNAHHAVAGWCKELEERLGGEQETSGETVEESPEEIKQEVPKSLQTSFDLDDVIPGDPHDGEYRHTIKRGPYGGGPV